MNRVLIIGCPGAGKSSFARKLREKTGLPLSYLDNLWHRPDKTTVSREQFDSELNKIMRNDRWIIDGNYLRTLPERLRLCDTVFLLDYSVENCIAGVEARIGKAREDMPWVETEFDPDFRQWILNFPKVQLPRIYELLREYQDREIVIFKSRTEADEFLENFSVSIQSEKEGLIVDGSCDKKI